MTFVSMESILKRVPNVYEAVMIAAKEARRINEERLAQKALFVEEEEPAQEENAIVEREHIIDEEKEEKVTVQALKMLIEGGFGSSSASDED